MKKIDYKLIQALDFVLNEQSFEKAAAALNITQSAVSQRIKQLEQFVASPVIIRTQPIIATEVGHLLLRHYRQVRQMEISLVEQIFPTTINDPISIPIAINADSLASWFIPAVTPLLQAHNIQLNLQVGDENNTQEILKRGEVYAALSCQPESFAGCKTQHLGFVHYKLCASPLFIEKYFKQQLSPECLRGAPGLMYDAKDSMHADYIKKHFGIEKHEYPVHVVRSSEAFVALTLAGVAYGLLPETQADNYIESGELIDLLPQQHLIQPLYWHSWVLERGIFKLFSSTVVEFATKLLKHNG